MLKPPTAEWTSQAARVLLRCIRESHDHALKLFTSAAPPSDEPHVASARTRQRRRACLACGGDWISRETG
ncbi:hypothetical protein BV22DRAFT_1041456 [Leucogyrophana mollusca]|uniref:Uncharacterized protein n=1 Tax=Leucogyrophana mollusca TaxID=85980 RepID=A0ACB8AZB2_9AGAM|nr:hypothetical protein BV22DRAFT_1041456 [Leucogyrophana mollusca]